MHMKSSPTPSWPGRPDHPCCCVVEPENPDTYGSNGGCCYVVCGMWYVVCGSIFLSQDLRIAMQKKENLPKTRQKSIDQLPCEPPTGRRGTQTTCSVSPGVPTRGSIRADRVRWVDQAGCLLRSGMDHYQERLYK